MQIFVSDLIGDTFMQLPALSKVEELIIYTPEGSLSDVVIKGAKDFLPNFTHKLGITLDQKLECGSAMGFGINHRRHMCYGYAEQLNVQINIEKDFPKLSYLSYHNGQLQLPKKALVFARHSSSCTGNDPAINNPNKCINNEFWLEVADIAEYFGWVPIAIGTVQELEQKEFQEWPYAKIYGYDLVQLMSAIEKSEATVISVDTGIKFLAAATGNDVITLTCALPSWLIGVYPTQDGQTIINLDTAIQNPGAHIERIRRYLSEKQYKLQMME